ncbi:PKD domain-containing protein [Acidicapsa dinghuensis]|uniref:PKD domain-containing protein n=1 Tax=Acidicapsa dinghuensis TaxID=2218256 RepID=A0ABW1EAS8_9BACT|nr:PKD domain-containing protein [Acidicapsa dinghuensis]
MRFFRYSLAIYFGKNDFPSMRSLYRKFLLFFALALTSAPFAGARVWPVPVPPELRSTRFTVAVDGKPVDVVHAAASYDYVSIETNSAIKVTITAAQQGFWDRGVDVQPWRLGLRPTRKGQTIELEIKDPVKLAISRPQDFLNHATMLFLFVTKPTVEPKKAVTSLPSYHYVGPGIHKGSINPKSGETWLLAPGAVVLGSLNLFHVHDVNVLGRGVIVYSGPQNPADDDGWMQKPDWHCIGALDAHKIHIEGVTCLVRSRTWSIQMKDSTDFSYEDLRVIGGNPGNANQDGMDWLGGGNTTVKDSFFRTSDDVFAIQGNWDGYGHDKMILPGHDVANILIENSELSTSISNIMRAGWPEKIFNSHNVTLRNSDVMHGGIGSCGPSFALFTFWGADGAKGTHTGYTFENLWLDDWYTLFQIEQEQPGLSGFTFRNIWALQQPPLLSSNLRGPIKNVRIENLKFGQGVVTSDTQIPLRVSDGAQQPVITPGDKDLHASFQFEPAFVQPNTPVIFSADTVLDKHARYTWYFGDGTTAHGQQVKHRYEDALGTELDGTAANGTGRFRVLLEVEDKKGNQDWSEQTVDVVSHLRDPGAPGYNSKTAAPGLDYQIFPGTWPELPTFSTQTAVFRGVALTVGKADSRGFTRYAVEYGGYLHTPTDGAYTFHLLARDGARLRIDGQVVAETGPPFSEVCGSSVNAMRYDSGSIALREGYHVVQLDSLESMSPGAPRLMWSGPGFALQELPANALSHATGNSIQTRLSSGISTLQP